MTERLVRAFGGDPRTVRALADGLRRATSGRLELEVERRGGMGLAPELMPALVGTLLGFLSFGLAGLVFALRDHPAFTTFLVAAAHASTCLLITVFLMAPALLEDDDALTIGWWPVSLRDVALARLSLVLGPVVRASLVLLVLPVCVHAIVGPVPLLDGLGLALGLVLQGIAVTFGLTALLLGLVVRVGRDRARRVAQVGGIVLLLGATLGPTVVPLFAGRPETRGVHAEVPELPAWLPPGWYAAWGRLGADPPDALPWAVLGAAVAAAVVPLAFRGFASRRRGEDLSPRAGRPRPAPLVALVAAWLRPFTPGREGFTVRRLLAGHLREDWHLAALRAWPIAVAGLLAGAAVVDPAQLAGLAEPAGALPVRGAALSVLAALYLPLPVLGVLVASQDHRAAWLLAQADLDPHRLLSAVRGVVRGLALVPALAILGLLLVRCGASAQVVAGDLVVFGLTFEFALRVAQRSYLVLPFSRSWSSPPEDFVIAWAVGLVPVSTIAVLWMVIVHDPFTVGKAVTWALLVLGIALVERSSRRAVERAGLHLELAPPERS